MMRFMGSICFVVEVDGRSKVCVFVWHFEFVDVNRIESSLIEIKAEPRDRKAVPKRLC
jgi:hypothetical protein